MLPKQQCQNTERTIQWSFGKHKINIINISRLYIQRLWVLFARWTSTEQQMRQHRRDSSESHRRHTALICRVYLATAESCFIALKLDPNPPHKQVSAVATGICIGHRRPQYLSLSRLHGRRAPCGRLLQRLCLHTTAAAHPRNNRDPSPVGRPGVHRWTCVWSYML